MSRIAKGHNLVVPVDTTGPTVVHSAGDLNNDIDFGAFTYRDPATGLVISAAAKAGKRSDAAFEFGAGNGALLDSPATKPLTGTLHWFLIWKADGTNCYGCASSLTPTLPPGYIGKRRVYSHATDVSGNNKVAFVFRQQNSMAYDARFKTIARDINENPDGARNNRTFTSLPSGISVLVTFDCGFSDGGGTTAVASVQAVNADNQTPSTTAAPLVSIGVGIGNSISAATFARLSEWTNTSRQVAVYGLEAADSEEVICPIMFFDPCVS